jgi:hypothetical protein
MSEQQDTNKTIPAAPVEKAQSVEFSAVEQPEPAIAPDFKAELSNLLALRTVIEAANADPDPPDIVSSIEPASLPDDKGE